MSAPATTALGAPRIDTHGLADHPLFAATRRGRRLRRQVYAWRAAALADLIRSGLYTPQADADLARAAGHMLRTALQQLEAAQHLDLR